MKALLFLLLVSAPPRDPDYDAVLAAYKAKKWVRFDGLSAKFLKEKPDYKFAHSVRFMRADSFFKRKRYDDAERACRLYLRLHEGAVLERRARRVLIQSLNKLARHREALDAGARGYEKAVSLEGLGRFEEAAKELEALPYREQVAFRLGVVRFRQRRFDVAKKHLEAHLRKWPKSKYAAKAKDYLACIDPPYKRIEKGVVLDYDGKYKDDARLRKIMLDLPASRASALKHISMMIGREMPDRFLVRLADSGKDRSGRWAEVRTEVVGGKPRSVLILSTEHLMLGTHDLWETLIHELYHCVQRELLGEAAHLSTPKWMREGTALFVAGQANDRARTLAAYVGARDGGGDPPDRLVNGLGGRHTLEDYAEDAAAFLAVRARYGEQKLSALLRRLLETPDVSAAIQEVLDEDFKTFEKHASAYARQLLRPLLDKGRAAILRAKGRLQAKDYKAALGLLRVDRPNQGVYRSVASYYRARALFRLERYDEALQALDDPGIARTTLVSNAKLLELRILKAMGSEGLAEAARRARLDLEPFRVYSSVLKLLDD